MNKLVLMIATAVTLNLNAQKPLTTSPLEVFGDHTFIQLSVDGSRPLNFIFDTGDGLTVIDTDIALELKLQLDHSSKKTSAQGSIEGSLIKHNYIEMSGFRLESDIEVYATSLKHLEISIGQNIDGIIGYDLLQHYAVVLDGLNKQMKIFKPGEYKYGGFGEKYTLDFEQYIPFISATVTLNNGEKFQGNYFVSTGAGTTLDFNSKFAKKNDVAAKTGDHYSYLVKGLGNTETLHYEGRVQDFKIGKLHFENLPVGISEAKHGIQANKKMDGIIGNRILKNYIVIFDYENRSMFLERYIGTRDEFHVNACGFEVQLADDMKKVLIHRIYEIGPASDQGIQVNDELVEINGTPVSEMTLPEIVRQLNKGGETVDIKISSFGRERTISLKLEELI
ncbi:MAG: aspartyl protease family protein [Cyclobacteriaceae bacterium]